MAPNTISCAGCRQPIVDNKYLQCSQCSQFYDLLCADIHETHFCDIMTTEHKKIWKCEECKSKMPKGGNINTPVCGAKSSKSLNLPGQYSDLGLENVTLRNKNIPNWSPESADSLEAEIRLFREEMRAVRDELREFKNIMTNLTSAVTQCNQRIDTLSARVDALEDKQSEKANHDTGTLERTIAELKLDLNDRDQELLSNDLEIAGIPENKNEGIIHIVLGVASKLGVQLEERDIVSAERAGAVRPRESIEAGGGGAPRPRPLVVRVARRALRDQMLSAARVRRGLTTADMDLGAAACHFYVNERLTRYNRQLFYKARQASDTAKWKYVWTRDGKIYARKEHGATRHRLRTETDVCRVFDV